MCPQLNNQGSQRIAVALIQRGGPDADSAQIADAVASAWHQIADALTPIIGPTGFAALYTRSFHDTAATHPWLRVVQSDAVASMDLVALKAALAQQDGRSAAMAGGEMIQTLRDLLGNLIGPALTARLLQPTWDTLMSGSPARGASK